MIADFACSSLLLVETSIFGSIAQTFDLPSWSTDTPRSTVLPLSSAKRTTGDDDDDDDDDRAASTAGAHAVLASGAVLLFVWVDGMGGTVDVCQQTMRKCQVRRRHTLS